MNTLLRPCLGCGATVRGKPRCADCQRQRDRAKAARRPDLHNDARERERRRRVVADHRARVGDWCPGLGQHPAHPSADLVADHLVEVAGGGLASGPLRVLCRSENSRRSAWLATGLGPTVAAAIASAPKHPTLFETVADATDSPISAGQATPRQPKFQREASSPDSGDGRAGPVVA
jgi:hypothetical protein